MFGVSPKRAGTYHYPNNQALMWRWKLMPTCLMDETRPFQNSLEPRLDNQQPTTNSQQPTQARCHSLFSSDRCQGDTEVWLVDIVWVTRRPCCRCPALIPQQSRTISQFAAFPISGSPRRVNQMLTLLPFRDAASVLVWMASRKAGPVCAMASVRVLGCVQHGVCSNPHISP